MRILLVRLGAFGDIIHTLPLAHDLHQAGHQVEWLCEDRWSSLVAGSATIAAVHQLPRGQWRRESTPARLRLHQARHLVRHLRRRSFDLVIDGQGLLKSALPSALCGASTRAGHARPRAREGAWLVGGRRIPAAARHVVDQQRLLGLAAGLPRPTCQPDHWHFPLPAWPDGHATAAAWLAEQALNQPLMLNVGAGWPTKCWPTDNQIAFCRIAAAAGNAVVVVWGGAKEQAVAQQVVAAADSELVHMAPPTDLPTLAGLFSRAGAVVSGDTGPLHLAFAAGSPCIGLFGPVPASRNGPLGRGTRVFQAPARAWERRDVSHSHMHLISAEQVFAACVAVRSEGRTP